ncbi:MAG TPA: hypothetical protein VJY62_14795 [Bacteroidia bacterium]|nr:hypothetical protein [Bacteroidia bacterium]
MSKTTEIPSFATNEESASDGMKFDIPSGDAVIHVKVSNDKIKFKPVPKGATTFSGKGLTHADLFMTSVNTKLKKEITLNHTSKLMTLMKFEKDKTDKKNKLAAFPEIKYKLKIFTDYTISKGKSIDDFPSSYGRGTTTDDVTEEDTSLRFHESQHGSFALTFLNSNPVPVLELKKGLLKEEVDSMVLKFFGDFNSYYDKFKFHFVYDVDCTGTLADFCSEMTH